MPPTLSLSHRRFRPLERVWAPCLPVGDGQEAGFDEGAKRLRHRVQDRTRGAQGPEPRHDPGHDREPAGAARERKEERLMMTHYDDEDNGDGDDGDHDDDVLA